MRVERSERARAGGRGWIVFGLALALMALGCDQSVDDGDQDSGVVDQGVDLSLKDGTPADQSAGEGSVADDTGITGDGVAGTSVEVIYGGQTNTVDLGQLTTVDFEGTPHVLASDVVEQALPGTAQDGLTADFTAGDGFKPGSKSNCGGLIPVPGENLAKAYIDPATRNLKWDASLNYPGCLFVDDLAKIELADKP